MCLYTITQLIDIPGYQVTEILSMRDDEIHVKIKLMADHRGRCSGCGEIHEGGYHSSKEMVAEGMRLGRWRLIMHIIKKRNWCEKVQKIRTEEIEWIKKGVRVTKALAREVNRLTAITTNEEAGWYLGMNDEKVYRIDKALLEELAEQRLKPTLASLNISVDEVAWKKHHRYLTNVVDVDEKVITWNEKGRKAEVLDKYYESLGEENCQKLETVALDGARTYISSTEKYAVNALIVLEVIPKPSEEQ